MSLPAGVPPEQVVETYVELVNKARRRYAEAELAAGLSSFTEGLQARQRSWFERTLADQASEAVKRLEKVGAGRVRVTTTGEGAGPLHYDLVWTQSGWRVLAVTLVCSSCEGERCEDCDWKGRTPWEK